ncbi:MAG: flagellar motor switch protein FliN [Thermanaerothrix sp.]|uniref:flagellar motor switch protein FliN n=1 Tax=Thermanaerothrix sp. TaxID=2972675 RepID=UPI003C7DDA78
MEENLSNPTPERKSEERPQEAPSSFERPTPPVPPVPPKSIGTSDNKASLDMLYDILLRVTVELGRTQMSLRQVLDLQNGSVVELDRLAGDLVDIYVNDRLFARGEVVVVDDKFGVRISELISQKRDKES